MFITVGIIYPMRVYFNSVFYYYEFIILFVLCNYAFVGRLIWFGDQKEAIRFCTASFKIKVYLILFNIFLA